MTKVISTELESGSEPELQSDTESEAKLESDYVYSQTFYCLYINDCFLGDPLLLWASQKLKSYFAKFSRVKGIVIVLTLEKSKN